jgi:hypothetical protein
MNKMKINVLWIDDLYKIQYPDYASDAEFEGIYLNGFESHEEGIAELEKNLNLYDAVILDAKVKNLKSDVDTGLTGLTASRDYLNKLNAKGKYLPYFIFTGQPDYKSNEMFRQSYGDFYIKGDDNQKLWDDIVDRVKNKADYFLKEKYSILLELGENAYLGKDSYQRIFDILKNAFLEDNPVKDFNQLRQLIELVFTKFNLLELIPEEISAPNQASRFISQKHENFDQINNVFHPTFAENVFRFLNIVQDGSHLSDHLNLKVNEYVNIQNNEYLYKSTVFLLMDILISIKRLIDDYPNRETNKTFWKKKEETSFTFEGKIEKDTEGFYFCGEFALNEDFLSKKNYKVGDKIIILEHTLNTSYKTKSLYPKYASKIQKRIT